MMHEYTVIGFYADSGLRYVGHTESESVEEAIQQTAELYEDESILIVAVISGHHKDLMECDYLEDTEDLQNAEGE